MLTIAPTSVKPLLTQFQLQELVQVPADTLETMDVLLLPKETSPPSPAKKPQEVKSDTNEGVLEPNSGAEKSDWSDVEY